MSRERNRRAQRLRLRQDRTLGIHRSPLTQRAAAVLFALSLTTLAPVASNAAGVTLDNALPGAPLTVLPRKEGGRGGGVPLTRGGSVGGSVGGGSSSPPPAGDPPRHPCSVNDDVTVRNGVARDLAAGRFESVASCLTAYVARYSDSAIAWYNLGYARAQLGDTARALEALARACALEPGSSAFWAQRSVLAAALGHRTEALEAARRAQRLAPDSPVAHARVAEAVRGIAVGPVQYAPGAGGHGHGHGQHQQHRQHRQRHSQSSAPGLSRQAQQSQSFSLGTGDGSSHEHGRSADASSRAPRSLLLAPPSSLRHGAARYCLAEGEDAALRAALLEPWNGARWYALGEARMMNGRFLAAGAALRQALRRADTADPSIDTDDVFMLLAHVHAARPGSPGKDGHRDAVALLRTVVRRRPESAQAWFLLGECLVAIDDVPAALAAYREALKIDYRHAGALAGLVHVRAEVAEWDDANVVTFGLLAVVKSLVARASPSMPLAQSMLTSLPFPPSFVRAAASLNAAAAAEAVAARGPERYPTTSVDPWGPGSPLARVAVDAVGSAPYSHAARLRGSRRGPVRIAVATDCADRDGPAVYRALAATPGADVVVFDACLSREAGGFASEGEGEGAGTGEASLPSHVRRVPAEWGAPELAAAVRATGADVLFSALGDGFRRSIARTREWIEFLAHTPAPVQIVLRTGGGVVTTGASYVDYVVADTTALPPTSAARLFSEKVIFLPHTHVAAPVDAARRLDAARTRTRAAAATAAAAAAATRNAPRAVVISDRTRISGAAADLSGAAGPRRAVIADARSPGTGPGPAAVVIPATRGTAAEGALRAVHTGAMRAGDRGKGGEGTAVISSDGDNHAPRLRLPKRASVFVSPGPVPSLSPLAASTWAAILHRVPDSAIVVATTDPGTLAALRREFAARGVDPDRVHGAERPLDAVLATVNDPSRVVTLDPPRVSDPRGAAFSLASEVPVVTLAGHTAASRSTASVVAESGCAQLLVTNDLSSYVSRAVALAVPEVEDENVIVFDDDDEDEDEDEDGDGDEHDANFRSAVRACLSRARVVSAATYATSLRSAAEMAFDMFLSEARSAHVFVG